MLCIVLGASMPNPIVYLFYFIEISTNHNYLPLVMSRGDKQEVAEDQIHF